MLKDNVQVAFGNRGGVFAWPFNADIAIRPEGLNQIGLGYIPRNPAEKNFAG